MGERFVLYALYDNVNFRPLHAKNNIFNAMRSAKFFSDSFNSRRLKDFYTRRIRVHGVKRFYMILKLKLC